MHLAASKCVIEQMCLACIVKIDGVCNLHFWRCVSQIISLSLLQADVSRGGLHGVVLSKGFSISFLRWPFQQGRTQTPSFHPKELHSPALENMLKANDGPIPPTRTTNRHKQATMGKEKVACPPALEKRWVTHVLLKVGVAWTFGLAGHFHLPIIAQKHNVTIVVCDCDTSMRDGKVRFDKRTTAFKPDGQQQWHELHSMHPRSMRMSADMASTIFLVHKHDIHCPHLSFPADIQEPDEAELVTEEPKEGGEKTLLQSKTKQITCASSCSVKLVGSNPAVFF
jgi:hypothetical protein